MKDSLDDVCDRFQEKIGLLDEVIKELKEALINAQESLGMSVAEIERAVKQIAKLGAECLTAKAIEREPLPPYKERLHPRKHWQRKPYWLRTRSNPQRRGYH